MTRLKQNTSIDPCRFSVTVVLGGQIELGRRRVFQVRADERGRGHRKVSRRFDRAERPIVDANVAVAGVVRVEPVHDEDFDQRVRSCSSLRVTYFQRVKLL